MTPDARQARGVAQVPTARPGEERGAERGGLDLGRAQDLAAREVGERAQQEVALREPAVHAQRAVGERQRLAHVGAALRDAFEHRARELGACPSRATGRGTRRAPRRRATACRAPAARARSATPPLDAADAASRETSAAIARDAELDQPVDRAARGDHRALEAERARAVAELPQRERVGAGRGRAPATRRCGRRASPRCRA